MDHWLELRGDRPSAVGDGVSYSSGWKAVTKSNHRGGSANKAMKPGSTAMFSFTGRSVGWISTKGAQMGTAAIEVDGVQVAVVDLAAAKNQFRSLVWAANWDSSAAHTIVIRVPSPAARPRVDVDGFIVLR